MPTLEIRPSRAMEDLIAGHIDEDEYYERIVELARSEMEAELTVIRANIEKEKKQKQPKKGKRKG